MMDTARYYVALLTVVLFPPPLLAWLAIHPLAGLFRRLGIVISYILIFSFYAVGMYAIWSVRGYFMRIDFGFSAPLSLLAMLLLLVSIYVRVLWRRIFPPTTIFGFPEIRGLRGEGDLVTTGIYSRIRHPRYLEVGLGLWAIAFFSNYLAAYAVGVAYLPLIYLVARLEERELKHRFGAVYEEYCSRVPRFVPRIR